MKSDVIKGFLAVLISAILFSSKGVIIKLAYREQVDPITLLTFRMGLALPVFLVALWLKGGFKQVQTLHIRDITLVFIMAFLGYYISPILDFIGLLYVTAGLERLVLYIYPTLVVIISALFLKTKISKTTFLSLIITYTGLLLVFLNTEFATQEHLLFGIVCILGCAFTFALYLVFSAGLIAKMGSVNYTSWVMVLSGLFFIIHYAIRFQSIQLLTTYSNHVYVLFSILTVFCTIVPSFLMSYGIKMIGSSKTAIGGTLGPIWTILLAALLLGETVTFIEIVGTICVISGVLLIAVKK